MASSNNEISRELPPLGIRLYKDGRVERKSGTEIVPASLDPITGVHSKDRVINPDTNLSARIYLPKINNNKLPLLIYFHGGGFCIESAFSPLYRPFCNSLAMSSSCVIVSVNYRLAPENPITTLYEDCWEAVKWVVSENDTWLTEHADFDRIYFGGDSAGANIAHRMAIRVGTEGLSGSGLSGVILIHPYFWGREAIRGETRDVNMRRHLDAMWLFVCPDSSELCLDNPFINPRSDPGFSGLGCDRALVFVAEKDMFRERGWDYFERLGASEWKGKVEIFQTNGENHVFHLFDPNSENAKDLVKRVGLFLNQ